MSKGWASRRVKRRLKRAARKFWHNLVDEVSSATKSGSAAIGLAISTGDNWWDRRYKAKQEIVGDRIGSNNPTFMAKHPWTADVRDWFSSKGHDWMDKRELRGGVLTEEEFNKFSDFDSVEEWRQEMARIRHEDRERQRSRNRDVDYGPLVMVYGGGQTTSVPRVKHTGFRPPQSRPSYVKPVKSAPGWQPPKQRVRKRRPKNHIQNIADKWQPQLRKNASDAMAADGRLKQSLQGLQEFVEDFPETRTEVHAHAGAFGEYGANFSQLMEQFVQTLAQGKGEDNPGMPPEVLQHLAPLKDMGEQMRASCDAFLAAWEDYFAAAIQAAKDEYTPSKQALNS